MGECVCVQYNITFNNPVCALAEATVVFAIECVCVWC